MKKIWLIPLLILALVLAACADGGAAQTPGALGTEPVLGTDTGLGTDAGLGTEAVTEAVEPTEAATTAATEAATAAATEAATEAATAVATTAAESGIVAIPYEMFEVASLTGEIGTGGADQTGAGTQVAGTEPAGTEAAGTPQATTAAGTETAGETAGDRLLVRASQLLGSEVVDMNGDTVGSVNDVFVNETGLIQYVVVDAADFLEGTGGTGTGGDTGTGAGTPAAGTQDAATTPEAVGTLDDSTQVVGTVEAVGTTAAGTPEGVATSTVGEGTAVAETGVMADEDTVLIFNGTADDLQTQAIMLPENLLDDESAMLNISGGDMPADLADLNGLLRVSQLTDDSVINAQDEELGQVEDWIVDLEQGMVEYGVVDFGGFLGIAENTVAVPWAQFTVNAEASAAADANLMLDVTEDTLQNAPQLNIGEWPSWPTPVPMDWETETRTFWETAS